MSARRERRRRRAARADASPARALEAAIAAHRAGRLADAERAYEALLARAPRLADARHLLGVVHHQTGRHASAARHIERAIRERPDQAAYHGNLGEVYRALGDTPRAVAEYARAIALAPRRAAPHGNLGAALAAAGALEEAARHLDQALALAPDLAEAHYHRAGVAERLGDRDAAVHHFRRAAALAPGRGQPRLHLARLLRARGALHEARDEVERHLADAPDSVPALVDLGNLAWELGHPDDAARQFERAAGLAPDSGLAQFNLGGVYLQQDRIDEARACYRAAQNADPTLAEARWSLPRLLPAVYERSAEIEVRRAEFADGLAQLERGLDLGSDAGVEQAFRGVAVRTNFQLNYQGRDDTALQARFGGMVDRVMRAAFPSRAEPPTVAPPGAGERLRVAFVSECFWNHTVAKLFRGWIERLDRRRFEIHCHHLGARRDGITRALAQASDRYSALDEPIFYRDRRAFESVCAGIADGRPHAIVYPEVGMHQGTVLLAALPLAPVQYAAWGHPVTTGLPAVGGFLSAELMEPEDAGRCYTERLVRLPNLGIACARPALPASERGRADLGLPAAATVYLCCQSLFKYLPEYDALYARIAALVPEALLVFVAHPSARVTERFRARLDGAFERAGVRAHRHIRIVARLAPADWAALMRMSDVYLDTPGWSGGNTTLEAIACGLPPVTLPGAFLRARHTAGILIRLGLPELVAADADAYVSLATRLGRDREWREALRAEILARGGRLWDDGEAVAGLAAEIERGVAAAGG